MRRKHHSSEDKTSCWKDCVRDNTMGMGRWWRRADHIVYVYGFTDDLAVPAGHTLTATNVALAADIAALAA